MEPNAIEALHEAANKYEVDVVCCLYQNEYINCSKPNAILTLVLEKNDGDILKSFICESYIGNYVWNKLYKAEMFSSLRFPEGRVFEDVASTYKIMIATKRLVVIPDLLFHYRVRQRIEDRKSVV